MAELIHLSSEDANSIEATFLNYTIGPTAVWISTNFFTWSCTLQQLQLLCEELSTFRFDILNKKYTIPFIPIDYLYTLVHLFLGLTHKTPSLVSNGKPDWKSFFIWMLNLQS